ncbi:hypothetical protein JCM8547_006629 [Rhodosporidiobolus lusitaniae]
MDATEPSQLERRDQLLLEALRTLPLVPSHSLTSRSKPYLLANGQLGGMNEALAERMNQLNTAPGRRYPIRREVEREEVNARRKQLADMLKNRAWDVTNNSLEKRVSLEIVMLEDLLLKDHQRPAEPPFTGQHRPVDAFDREASQFLHPKPDRQHHYREPENERSLSHRALPLARRTPLRHAVIHGGRSL